MPKVTRADLLQQDPGEGVPIIEALAPLATGLNEDGTPFELQTSGMAQKWRDEFNGTTLNANEWTSRVTGAGASLGVAGSLLSLVTGTASGNLIEVESKRTFTPGCRIYITLGSISQRIANQEFTIELVEATAAPDSGSNRAVWRFTSTTNTNGDIATWSQGDAGVAQTVTNLTGTSGASVFEIDLGHEEAWFYNTAVDSAAGRLAGNRISRKVPDPNVRYMVRLRAKNTGAAASTTSFNVDSVLVEDYNFFPIEIARGRGGATAGEAVPVILPSALPAGGNIIGGTLAKATTAPGGVGPYKNINVGAGALIKAAVGQIYTLQATNLAAAPRFLKLYNKATTPVVGTDIPVMTFAIPAGQTMLWTAADIGHPLSSGIGIAATTGVADADATLAGANEVVVNALYA